MNQDNKPKYLYRGVCIHYDKLDEVILGGSDLVPPNAPFLDEKGRKIVLDGNEYGVYMTDNEQMVKDVYGDVHNGGTPIQGNLVIGMNPTRINIPDVGISYVISTDGVSVRRPRITSALKGHYNNGFAGDEWIADMIPADKYKVIRIRIGKDLLHDHEDIEITNGDTNLAKEETKKIIEMRRYRLESLVDEVLKMSDMQRRNIGIDQIELLKDIFGPNGVRYININSIDVSSNAGKIRYLLASFYNQNHGIIDYKTLGYIETLKQKILRLSDPNSIDALNQIIAEDLRYNAEKRASFINRKAEEGIEAKTDVFDNKSNMINGMLTKLEIIADKNKENDQLSEIDNIHFSTK